MDTIFEAIYPSTIVFPFANFHFCPFASFSLEFSNNFALVIVGNEKLCQYYMQLFFEKLLNRSWRILLKTRCNIFNNFLEDEVKWKHFKHHLNCKNASLCVGSSKFKSIFCYWFYAFIFFFFTLSKNIFDISNEVLCENVFESE